MVAVICGSGVFVFYVIVGATCEVCSYSLQIVVNGIFLKAPPP